MSSSGKKSPALSPLAAASSTKMLSQLPSVATRWRSSTATTALSVRVLVAPLLGPTSTLWMSLTVVRFPYPRVH
ncbi:hypothetical protein SLEP1_g50761 [Rubroshorea leprosula]|uniref:Uncharacterized protein n=1 Tax=Rubroshorea leprosula TaxID=152421 RepID=A0AAV5M1Z0_9ROSI|nr:hypothetical protein SLEP1_g50761 [Rubroshorea leprosula]